MGRDGLGETAYLGRGDFQTVASVFGTLGRVDDEIDGIGELIAERGRRLVKPLRNDLGSRSKIDRAPAQCFARLMRGSVKRVGVRAEAGELFGQTGFNRCEIVGAAL